MNEFKDASLRLQDYQRKVAQYEKELGRKCDWEIPEDVALHKHEMRFSERVDLLNLLVPNRVCPVCETLRISPRSWVIKKDKKLAICRSCFQRNIPDKKVVKMEISRTLFSNISYRFGIDAFGLQAAREEADSSEWEFARRMGWSHSYQCKIESGEVKTVDLVTAEAILGVFREHGFILKDCL